MASTCYVWSSLGTCTDCYFGFCNKGYSTLLVASVSICFAQAGSLLNIFLRTKEDKVKQLAIPAFISALFGVTEPAIYGITLPMRTPFIRTCIAGAIQGAFLGFFNVTGYTMGGMGLFAIPSYILPAGMTGDTNNVWYFIASIVISFILGFVLTQFTKIPNFMKIVTMWVSYPLYYFLGYYQFRGRDKYEKSLSKGIVLSAVSFGIVCRKSSCIC